MPNIKSASKFNLYAICLALFFPVFYFLILPFGLYLIYLPQVGDIVFQSLNRSSDLVRAIEGVTKSPYSHCGIVLKVDGEWVVNEAYRPVSNTPLREWMSRGRGYRVDVYRLQEPYLSQVSKMVLALENYQNLPYDSRYRMEDDAIYCSELVYKAFQDAFGEPLSELESLGDLNWMPFEKTIIKYEKGPVPLDRLMITPLQLTRSDKMECVLSLGFSDL